MSDLLYKHRLGRAASRSRPVLLSTPREPANGQNGRANLKRLRNLLVLAVRAAPEHKTDEVLKSLAFADELTGLYNRRAFLLLASQQLKLAQRAGRHVLLAFADLDNLKQINDTFGHQEGDRALQQAAEVLRSTFRQSDIVARFGGDEFAILVNEPSECGEAVLRRRLEENLKSLASGTECYTLSLSLDVARSDRRRAPSLDELIRQADRALYEQKRTRQKRPSVLSGVRPES